MPNPPSQVPVALEFDQISKRFGATEALRGVSFIVEQGRFFALAGVNGAGKTTLIKCLLDLGSADAGRASIFGIDSRWHRARAAVAFLPERFVPPYYLSGAGFLRMMAALRGRTYVEHEAVAMLARLDLDRAALARPVRTYSKGMTQKLGLASCFLADRELTILDEPMGGLDPKARALVKELLADLKARGRTLFFTSHALADIEEVCDELCVLHAGAPRFVGTPAQMRAQSGTDTLERAFLRLIDAPRAAAP